MPLNVLLRRWVWLSFGAAISFVLLLWLDVRLKLATGFGTIDLQGAQSGFDYKRVFAGWIARPHAAAAGFSLGFGYLFMLLLGLCLSYSAIITREAFASKKGFARQLVSYLAIVPLLGVLANAIENGLAFFMLSNGTSDQLAQLAARAFAVKSSCFVIGLLFFASALPGYLRLTRAAKKAVAKVQGPD